MSEDTGKTEIVVSLRNLQRSFREGEQVHKVLDGVNIDINRGEIIALRGRSGSGKSTLLNLISGLDVPDQGTVVVANQSVTAMRERERTIFRREHIGFVYQAFNLVHTLTVADNVRLILELNGVPEPEANERISWLLEAVGLAERRDSYPDVLSGGEQQRVAIARAIAHNPYLLLADEPTGNLDDQTADQVLRLIDQLVRRSGGTMIIATHSAAVAANCDRVFELQHGILES
jgi:putative ABC transport system ATP-binding protein